MNPQQIPDSTDAKGVFGQLNGQPIRWEFKGVTHIVEGADVHPGIRLLWTVCEIDVPAGKAFLVGPERAIRALPDLPAGARNA